MKTLANASDDDVGGVRLREHRPLAAEFERVLDGGMAACTAERRRRSYPFQAADAIFIIELNEIARVDPDPSTLAEVIRAQP